MSAIVTLAGRRVGVKSLYNPAEDRKSAVGDQMNWREDAGLRNMSQRSWAPWPPAEQPGFGLETLMAVRYVAVLFGLQLPLTHNPFK